MTTPKRLAHTIHYVGEQYRERPVYPCRVPRLRGRKRVAELRALVRQYLACLDEDDACCTCEENDPCPLCRCRVVLGLPRELI